MTDRPALPGMPYGPVRKHSLTIAGHATSISLEEAFWQDLRAIAKAANRPLADLIAEIDANRGAANLSSAIRLFVLANVKTGHGEL